jgi:hypothetical protein
MATDEQPGWSLFDPPMWPDPAFMQAARDRLAREGVDEIVDYEQGRDRSELIALYGPSCFCGEPFQGRRSARILDFNDTIELTEEAACINGHTM